MKNNRASLNTEQSQRLLRNIGDPQFVIGTLSDLSDDGQTSVIQLNLGRQSHVDLYEQLHNNPDKFEVIQETDFGGGRSDVKCIVRYVRKGPWKLERPKDLEMDSPKKSSRSKKKSEKLEERVVGFAMAPRRKESEEKKVVRGPKKKKAKPKKKKIVKPKKKKAKKTKKTSLSKKKPAKKSRPKKKKAPRKKRSSRSSG